MYVRSVRIRRLGPFDELELSFLDRESKPRPLTLVHGDGGSGKSTILSSLAHTRPGKILPPSQMQRRGDADSFVVCEWSLAAEDAERPHPIRLASPNVKLGNDDAELLRRREQTHFDRRATEGPGFAFVEIPALRYFGRATVGLNDPARSLMRYDARASTPGTEATRPDLTRPCKQAIAYAAIAAALVGDRKGGLRDARCLGAAMDQAVNAAVDIVGYSYRGVEPNTLEPIFETPGGVPVQFERLPTQAKQLVAFVALPVRTFWAAHKGSDPREAEGVVVIDDVGLNLGPVHYTQALELLPRALPKAQWVLTTHSPYLAAACDPRALVTLRRQPSSDLVSIYEDELAITH